MSNPGYSRAHRALELSATLAALTCFALLARGLAAALTGAGAWTVAALCASLGYLAADFVSGFVHWMGDRLGSAQTPLVGANFVGPFRYHHVDPEDIARHDFIETNGNNCVVVAPTMAAVLWLFAPSPAVYALALSFGLSIFATNQFHKWAHAKDVPPGVRFLQRRGLILGPEHHQIHHTAPYDTYFCITTGWLNAPLARLRFFERLERALWLLFRVRAGEDDSKMAQAA